LLVRKTKPAFSNTDICKTASDIYNRLSAGISDKRKVLFYQAVQRDILFDRIEYVSIEAPFRQSFIAAQQK